MKEVSVKCTIKAQDKELVSNADPTSLCHIFTPVSFVAVQEFAGEDMSDLFLEERETAIRQAQDEKRKVQMAVPGILGPHEIPEEMQD